MKARTTRFLNDSGPRGAKQSPEVLTTSRFRSYRLLNLYEEAMLKELTINYSGYLSYESVVIFSPKFWQFVIESLVSLTSCLYFVVESLSEPKEWHALVKAKLVRDVQVYSSTIQLWRWPS